MKYLKRFLESKFQSEEDVSDYLLDRYGSIGPYTRYTFNSNLDFFIELKGTKKEIENFISNRIIHSEEYQLKPTKESLGEVEYQIIPSE